MSSKTSLPTVPLKELLVRSSVSPKDLLFFLLPSKAFWLRGHDLLHENALNSWLAWWDTPPGFSSPILALIFFASFSFFIWNLNAGSFTCDHEPSPQVILCSYLVFREKGQRMFFFICGSRKRKISGIFWASCSTFTKMLLGELGWGTKPPHLFSWCLLLSDIILFICPHLSFLSLLLVYKLHEGRVLVCFTHHYILSTSMLIHKRRSVNIL